MPKRRTPKVPQPEPISLTAAEWDEAAMLAAGAECDLHEFLIQAWPIVVPGEAFQDNWHIDAICEHLEAVARLEIRDLLINIPPRFGKPVSVDAQILMGDGTLCRLGDICVGDRVISHTGKPRRVLAVHEQGLLPVVRVETNSGRTVITAPDHLFLTPAGWVPAEKLLGHVCANVAEPKYTAAEPARLSEEFAFAGYLIGDGSVSHGNFSITAYNPEVAQDVIKCAERLGFGMRFSKSGRISFRNKGGSNKACAWLRESGLKGKTSYTKRVPDWIFSAPLSRVALFLRAYWMCDGEVSKRRGYVTITSVSEGLLRDVQHLLLRFGVQTILSRRQNKTVGYVHWRLSARGENAARFAESISLCDRQRGALRPRHAFVQPLLTDSVASVQPAGFGECRCLTIEKDGTFTANDFVVHNSTSVSVMFPAWLWLRNAALRMLYSSYAQSLSTRDSVATRRLIDSPWYQGNWGYKFQIAVDQNEKTRFENDKKGYRLATSVGGSNTGEGGDLIVCDDPHNVQEVESEIVRTSAIRWWNEVMSTRGNNPATVCRIIIMQRSHEEDLAGDVLNKGGFTHLNLPMEFESKFSKASPILWTDPRQDAGALLWPDRYTPEEVAAQKKRMGSYAYAAQYQQRPAPLEGGMFKRADWRFYKTDPALMLKDAEDRCWSWDCAFKDLSTSDFVAGQAWMRKGANFYLLHQIRDRMSFSATKAAIKSGAAKFAEIGYKLVEDKANGTAVIDDLKSTVGGLVAIEPEGGKEARASVVEPYQEAGNIWLPDPSIAPWVEDYIEEFRVFPNGAYDDQVDATSQAIVWMLKRFNVKSGAVVASFIKTAQRPRAEVYYDPRYSSTPMVLSDRGDNRR